MARIVCRTPSTGRPLSLRINNVSTGWQDLVEAPDFSVPDTANLYPERDTLDTNRAIRPGEIFMLTPITAKNKTAVTHWIEVKLVTEENVSIEFGRFIVPGGETIAIPVQGRSLLKRDASATNGDRLQIRAETSNTFDVWASADEKPSSEHLGIE